MVGQTVQVEYTEHQGEPEYWPNHNRWQFHSSQQHHSLMKDTAKDNVSKRSRDHHLNSKELEIL